MRLNKFLSSNTDLSRRNADVAIANGRVTVNGKPVKLGVSVEQGDAVTLDGKKIKSNPVESLTIIMNKPVGYVCSRLGQGSKTIYELLPEKYQGLNIAGRLDKDSSGLVVLTNDGSLLNQLTHPSNNKQKVYNVSINKPLWPEDQKKIESGVDIGDDRPSRFKKLRRLSDKTYVVTLEEGRNRQIRRTFEALGYNVKSLRRTALGQYKLDNLKPEQFRRLN